MAPLQQFTLLATREAYSRVDELRREFNPFQEGRGCALPVV